MLNVSDCEKVHFFLKIPFLVHFHFIKAASAFCEMMETVLKQTSFFWIRQTWKRKQQREAGSHMEMIFVAERQSHLSCHWGGGGRDYICSKACLLLMKHGLTSLPVTQTDGAAAATAFSGRKQQHHHHLHTSSFQQQEQISAVVAALSSSFRQHQWQLSAVSSSTSTSSFFQQQQLSAAVVAFSSIDSFHKQWQLSAGSTAFSSSNMLQQQEISAAATAFSSSFQHSSNSFRQQQQPTAAAFSCSNSFQRQQYVSAAKAFSSSINFQQQ